jgi:hypothetical protein
MMRYTLKQIQTLYTMIDASKIPDHAVRQMFFKKGLWRTNLGFREHLLTLAYDGGINIIYYGGGRVFTRILYKILFEEPLYNMPIYINDENEIHAIAAKWRLLIAK